MLAAASGAEVIGVDLIPERLELAKNVGAAHALVGGKGAAEEIMDLTAGRGTEVSMDCSGSAAGRKLCLEAVREWGRVVYLGEGGSVTFEPSPLLLHKQLTLQGSCGEQPPRAPWWLLRFFDYGRASVILGALRDKEHTSTIIEMPDVEEHLFFVSCACPLPLSGSPRRTLLMVATTAQP